ncbi:hypothetical protein [Rhizobium sp. BK251]|uniref:hypothetical protein n=1 Tax=Rhizobium sp. BK251 TaxID=2512125 RepID=UPI0010483808|nr:hypothetical protein [Rhizobium sp. BK251]TCL72932.1 hypothetical protein EV286_104360 [Rhizobium sp. BK251]
MLSVRFSKTAVALALGAFVTFGALPAAQAQDANAQRVRVRGTIENLAGSTLTVKTREGTTAAVALKSGFRVGTVRKASADDIKPGDFVGIASLPGATGDAALEVVIFPASMKGTGEGSRPWDLKPNSTMTNATVANAVKAVAGHTITLAYQGKEKKITIPTSAPIVALAPASSADLKPGAPVFMQAERGADGTMSATQLVVGKNGVAPPM